MNQARPVAWLSKLFGREAGFSTAPFAQNANASVEMTTLSGSWICGNKGNRRSFDSASPSLRMTRSWVAFVLGLPFGSSYLEDDFGSELKFAGGGALGCG